MTTQKQIAEAAKGERVMMIKVGHATPESVCGDIYACPNLIAQRGELYVREMVRHIFESAYAKQAMEQEYRNMKSQRNFNNGTDHQLAIQFLPLWA